MISVDRSAPLALLGRGRSGAVFIAISAAIAAVIAHIGIDAAGDHLLAHDTYDDLAHGSRSITAVLVAGVLLRVAWRALFAAIAGRSVPTVGAPERACLGHGRQLLGIAAVAAGACLVLAAMEGVDLAAAGRRPDDVADLFGGSLILGLGLTLPIAAAVAVIAWRLVGWLAQTDYLRDCVAEARLLLRARETRRVVLGARRRRRCFAPVPARARNTAKRGPPRDTRRR